MKPSFLAVLLQSFFYLSSFAYANPCTTETGDGNIAPDDVLLEVQFDGPKNPFWSYVSSDPKSWAFKISQKNSRLSHPGFEQFAVSIGNNKSFELKNDLIFHSKNEFYVKPAKVQEILESYRTIIDDHRKKNSAALPPAALQLLHFYIAFNSPSKKATENWLNHGCTLGFGLNSLNVIFQTSDLKNHQQDFNFDLETNGPHLDGVWGVSLPSKFKLQSIAGVSHIEGLPIGTFIVKVETHPNQKIPITYLWSPYKKCEIKLLKDKTKTVWSVIENSCDTGKKRTDNTAL